MHRTAGFEEALPYSIALLDCGDYKVFGYMAQGIPDEPLSIDTAIVTTLEGDPPPGAPFQP